MNKNKIIAISIILNLLLIVICINSNTNTVLSGEKQIIKEMTEGEYESQITELNKSHEEYANSVNEYKIKIAEAITNQKVETSETATADEIVTNIGEILKARTSDADATADNISKGKKAYVDGQLIIGTGVDNTNSYNEGALTGQKVVKIASIDSSSNDELKTQTQTINVSSYEGYQNFTTSNFLLDSTYLFCGNTNSNMNRAWVGISHTKSYDASTGIFTITTTESHSEKTRGFHGSVYLVY